MGSEGMMLVRCRPAAQQSPGNIGLTVHRGLTIPFPAFLATPVVAFAKPGSCVYWTNGKAM
jgi:hypothetical protein